MRALFVGGAMAALACGAALTPDGALAQGANADGLYMKPAVPPAETSPIRRLSDPAQAWVRAEEARQTATPGDMLLLAMDIEENIGPAVLKVAERERLDSRDVVLAVMYEIMSRASGNLKREIRKLELAQRRRPGRLDEAQAGGRPLRHRHPFPHPPDS